uniref:Bucky ball n=1 Tax=Takifugu rubripes TaxID=31033 RepID=A0A3B5KIE4_TAKRU
ERNHSRPFFYVQPPSQPYFLYQHWQMNNPYSHYGLPGGFNFGRPAVHPYMYMHYPGFVYPPGPVYPVDHRRVFEPRHPAPAWSDVPPRQHCSQPCREMACSEAQTDPSDAVNKLIECLGKIRELDSGVASQSSGIFSPADEKKSEEEAEALPLVPEASCLGSVSTTCSDSAVAVYDAESSNRSHDPLSWSGGLEEDLPLDSSSVHEECSQQPGEVSDIQTSTSVTPLSVPNELLRPAKMASSQPGRQDAEHDDKGPKAERQGADQDYQIIKLPFESILATEDQAAGQRYGYLSMRSTHERMSVLSPSLDELSSREDIFSTDLDDADLYPKRVYAGRRLVEVVSRSPRAAEEVEEVWLGGSKRYVCACCGKNLTKVASRGKGHRTCWDEGGDSDEDSQYGQGCEQPVRVVVRKHVVPRKCHSALPWHVTKAAYKRGQYEDPADPANPEEGPALKLEVSEENPEESNDLQRGTCQGRSSWTRPRGTRWSCADVGNSFTERLGREALPPSDSGRWGDAGVIPRRRPMAQRQGDKVFFTVTERTLARICDWTLDGF